MKNPVDDLVLADFFTTAARAAIHERCALAFLHDVRGTMQALFSAFELLGRAARLSEGNPARVEKACDLARRAMSHHEKSTLDVLQLLTLQPEEPSAVDLPELVTAVTHFLRNEAASKHVTLAASAIPEVCISVERAKLHSLLVGLLTAAIEEIPAGSELRLSVTRQDTDAVITLGSHAGLGHSGTSEELLARPLGAMHPRELTLLFAQHFLRKHGGRMAIDAAADTHGTITLYYPAL